MSPQVPPRAVIFDLGDVLFTWSATTTTTISPGTLRKILSSPIWFEYECARISQHDCYTQVGKMFGLDALQIAEAFSQARESCTPDEEVVRFLRKLRSDGSVKVYAMSNIAQEDYEAIAGKIDWTVFDRVFTSAAAGMRKPDPNFFRYVIDEIDFAPEEVIFVDDKRENVAAAESLGVKGFIFDNSTVSVLRALFNNPLAKGYQFLQRNAKQFNSVTNSGVEFADNFAELLLLEATGDHNLVNVASKSEGTWNFFAREATLVPGGHFPDDLDTTSLALMVLPPKQTNVATSILDKMARYANDDGSILTYFDREKPRTDSVVSANVLACFCRYGRGHELPRTLLHVRDVLSTRSYMQGTRYYPSPDCCLFFFVRLLQSSENDIHVHSALESLLRPRVQERVGKAGDPLELAMRIIACQLLDIECSVDRQTLLDLQCQDGGWEAGWMYRYGSTGIKIGNRGVTTAFALNAIAPPKNVDPAHAVVKGNGHA